MLILPGNMLKKITSSHYEHKILICTGKGQAIIPILAYLASDVTAVPPSLAMSASFRRLLTSSRALATHALKCAVNSRRGDADSDDDEAFFRLLFFFFFFES